MLNAEKGMVIFQHVNQPLNEADLPDGLLSVSLLRHQVFCSPDYKVCFSLH